MCVCECRDCGKASTKEDLILDQVSQTAHIGTYVHVYACMHARMYVCVGIAGRHPQNVYACMYVCSMYVSESTKCVCMYLCMYVSEQNVFAFQARSTDINWLHTYIHTYINTYVHAQSISVPGKKLRHTYIHICMHTCTEYQHSRQETTTYIHTYMLTYMHRVSAFQGRNNDKN